MSCTVLLFTPTLPSALDIPRTPPVARLAMGRFVLDMMPFNEEPKPVPCVHLPLEIRSPTLGSESE